MKFTWKILEIFDDAKSVRYLLSATDESDTVETEGYHSFSDDVVYKPFDEIKEEDLIRWLDLDTTKNDANPIKSNLENQLKALKNSKKVKFPWLANTFTIEQELL